MRGPAPPRSSAGPPFALAAAVLFGVSGVVAADVFATVDPITVAQHRSVMAALVLGLVAHRRRHTSPGGRLGELAVFGAMLAAVTITYYWAIDRLGVGPGVTLQFLAPVLVLGWMRIVQRRPIQGATWGAAAVAVMGTALMNRVWDLAAVDLVGIASGLGAAITLAGYLILGERLGRTLPGLTVAAYGFAVSGLFWVLVTPPTIPDADLTVWLQLIWVGVAGTAAAFLLEIAALKRTDPGTVGVIATTEPVIAAGFAWMMLDQSLSPVQVGGGLMVVMGVATVQALTRSVAPDIPPQAV